MKKYILIITFLTTVLIVPITAFSQETFTGKLEGEDCIKYNYDCGRDRFDPYIYRERDIVLQLENGDYYYLPNLPMNIKFNHYRLDVRIVGVLNHTNRQINVSQFMVKRKGKYELVKFSR